MPGETRGGSDITPIIGSAHLAPELTQLENVKSDVLALPAFSASSHFDVRLSSEETKVYAETKVRKIISLKYLWVHLLLSSCQCECV